jgi:hypothetical protein
MFHLLIGSKSILANAIAVAIVIVGLSSTSANALNIIGLSPASQSVQVGSDFAIDIFMDFDEVVIGGGFEVTFDSSELSFLTFRFDQNFTANIFMLAPVDGEVDLPLEIAFGWLDFSGGGGPTGPTTVGQLTFRAEGPGPAVIVMTSSSSSNPGPYYAPGNASSPLAVEFGSTTLDVIAPPVLVPEPQSALLLVVGLIGLAQLGSARVSQARSKSLE